MRVFDSGIRSTLAKTRIKTAENARSKVDNAKSMLEDDEYTDACFLAITAIEEMGKTRTLQMVQGDIYPDLEIERIDDSGLQSFLRSHDTKAVRAAASGLAANHGAVRRHGRHEEADLNLSSGILLLAKINWMELRNSCLYTDVNISGKNLQVPVEEITFHHAYYFICMAYEILAEESEAGFGSPIEATETDLSIMDYSKATDFGNDMILDLLEFSLEHQEEFEPENLEFFVADPRWEDIREDIRDEEVRVDLKDRKEARKLVEDEMVDPAEVDESKLPDDVPLELHQEMIIREMVDRLTDAPYKAGKNEHPELEELRNQVSEYIEFQPKESGSK